MRTTYFSLFLAGIALVVSGCAGMEHKLGRGINNITEIPRGGEVRRSMEQTAFFRSPDEAYTTGFIHGFNRSLARTFVGAYEIITAPFPPYDPVIFPADPVYPDSYKPKTSFGLYFRNGHASRIFRRRRRTVVSWKPIFHF